jgi:hypothetical protein
VPRDARTDENGHAVGDIVTHVTVVGIESGTFLSREQAHASAWGEMPPPLLEHEPAAPVEIDDQDDDAPPPPPPRIRLRRAD